MRAIIVAHGRLTRIPLRRLRFLAILAAVAGTAGVVVVLSLTLGSAQVDVRGVPLSGGLRRAFVLGLGLVTSTTSLRTPNPRA